MTSKLLFVIGNFSFMTQPKSHLLLHKIYYKLFPNCNQTSLRLLQIDYPLSKISKIIAKVLILTSKKIKD